MKPAVIAWLAALLGAGCGPARSGGEEHAEHEDEARAEHAEHAADDAHEHAGEPGVLHVDHAMLRDLQISVQAAESRPSGDSVSVLGELRVNEDAYAESSAPIAARVVRVLAKPGDVVRAGQPLLELESPEVGRARAAQLTARARADLGRSALERKRALSADQIVPQRELQAAEADLVQAEAEQRGAEQTLAALSAQRGEGGRFTLVADVAGTVLARDAPRGRMLEPGQRLFAIADLSKLWLVAHAFERDALRIRTGRAARVTFAALPGRTFEGTVARVGDQVDPSSRTLDVLLTVENAEGVLRPGMSASALLPLGESNQTVVAVPVAALQRLPQGWCVFIALAEEGAFAIRAVGRGRDLGGEVEVVSGLRAGERVVVDGAFLLKAEADKARGGGEEHHH